MVSALRSQLLITLTACAVAMCFTACSEEEPSSPSDYIEVVTVLPGDNQGATYYLYDPDSKTVNEVAANDIPAGAMKQEYINVTSFQKRSDATITAAANSTGFDTTITALFTGGFIPGPGGATSSNRAAIAVAGEPLFTDLKMIEARAEHAMANLPNGRVLISGGYGPGIPTPVLSSAEVFSFDARTFTATGALRRARADHAAASLADGRVLLTGGLVLEGSGPATNTTASTEIYDPASGTFSDGPSMTEARFNHSAVTLTDGRVLVLGGNGSSSAEVYSPATNTFTPVGSMSVKHGLGHVALLLPNGKVLVIGGDSTFNINPSAVVELFDPATSTFSVAGSMASPRMQHFAVVLDSGDVLIGGGRELGGEALSTTEIYNVVTNSFTPGVKLPRATYHGKAARAKKRATPKK